MNDMKINFRLGMFAQKSLIELNFGFAGSDVKGRFGSGEWTQSCRDLYGAR